MYLLEPFLNAYYRNRMRTILQFAEVDDYEVPDPDPAVVGNCLLYIHVPFCESLCPYCSFHRYVYDEAAAPPYFDALRRELRMYRDRGYDFQSVYVGGGTPTINIPQLAETLDLARELFSIREISIETNPNHLVPDKLAALQDARINRLSVGVQSFDDTVLKSIGRLDRYGSGEVIQARLRETTGLFDTLNVDLIFNMPTQDEASVARDLDAIDSILPEQVTFYPLMTSPAVRDVLRRTLGPIDYRKEKRLFFQILERMKANYTGSTAWCFSRQESMIDEYIISYDYYAAAGSGAFGYLGDRIYANTFSVDEYISRIDAGRFPVARVKTFSPKDYLYYDFLMKLFGLRMDKKQFAAKFGTTYNRGMFPLPWMLRISGSVTETADEVALTDRGRYYWVMAMREFFIGVDTMRDGCRQLVLDKGTGPH